MTQTILLADDNPLFRQALAQALAKVLPAARILEAGTMATAARAAKNAQDLALILLDLELPGAVGASGIPLLHTKRPGVPILVISSAEEAAAAQVAKAIGAIGIVSKNRDLAEIASAIVGILGATIHPVLAEPHESNGHRAASLTPTQRKVLLAVLEGQLNKQIAHSLSITEATVKAHMTTIMRKLGVDNRTQAALMARTLGLDLTD